MSDLPVRAHTVEAAKVGEETARVRYGVEVRSVVFPNSTTPVGTIAREPELIGWRQVDGAELAGIAPDYPELVERYEAARRRLDETTADRAVLEVVSARRGGRGGGRAPGPRRRRTAGQ